MLGPAATAWPEITVRIRTVTGTPALPMLARACASAPGSYSEPSSRWIAHFRAQQSDVELDPPQHEAGADRRRETPACQLLTSSRRPPLRLAQPHATSSSTFTERGLRSVG